MKLLTTTVLSLIAVALAGFAQSTSVAGSHKDGREQFSELEKKITRSGKEAPDAIHDPDQIRAIRSELRGLVAQELKEGLNTPHPNEHALSGAIKALQGESAPSEVVGNTPFVKIFTLDGVKTAAVAYDLFEGGTGIPDNHPYIEFYMRGDSEWRRVAQAPTETDFEGCTFFVTPLEAQVKDEMWFLVSGFKIGDTGTRLKIRIFSYDGSSVRTVWQRSGLTHGEVSVSNNVITLEYDRKYHSADPNNRVHEEFQVVPDGLQCITPECE
jgi:hypothetical protein